MTCTQVIRKTCGGDGMIIIDSVCPYSVCNGGMRHTEIVGRKSELVLEGHRATVSPNSDNKLHFSRRAKSNFHV